MPATDLDCFDWRISTDCLRNERYSFARTASLGAHKDNEQQDRLHPQTTLLGNVQRLANTTATCSVVSAAETGRGRTDRPWFSTGGFWSDL